MLWYEYCLECQKKTLFRFLDCADCRAKGKICPIVICTECGDGYDSEAQIRDCNARNDFIT